MRKHYNAPLRWKWFMDKDIVWKPDLEEIKERYEKWMEKQTPRRASSTRSAPNIINPKGEALGPWDEEPPAPNESYERDSFCASDNEELLDESTNAGTQHEETDSVSGVESLANTQDTGNLISPPHELPDTSENGEESSTFSLPTLEKLRTRGAS